MKLSEAILKGCKDTVKIKFRFTDGRNGCCVLGAAIHEVTGVPISEFSEAVCHWDVLRNNFPELIENSSALWKEVTSRNNDTDESRESIAAWLAEKGL